MKNQKTRMLPLGASLLLLFSCHPSVKPTVDSIPLPSVETKKALTQDEVFHQKEGTYLVVDPKGQNAEAFLSSLPKDFPYPVYYTSSKVLCEIDPYSEKHMRSNVYALITNAVPGEQDKLYREKRVMLTNTKFPSSSLWIEHAFQYSVIYGMPTNVRRPDMNSVALSFRHDEISNYCFGTGMPEFQEKDHGEGCVSVSGTLSLNYLLIAKDDTKMKAADFSLLNSEYFLRYKEPSDEKYKTISIWPEYTTLREDQVENLGQKEHMEDETFSVNVDNPEEHRTLYFKFPIALKAKSSYAIGIKFFLHYEDSKGNHSCTCSETYFGA